MKSPNGGEKTDLISSMAQAVDFIHTGLDFIVSGATDYIKSSSLYNRSGGVFLCQKINWQSYH